MQSVFTVIVIVIVIVIVDVIVNVIVRFHTGEITESPHRKSFMVQCSRTVYCQWRTLPPRQPDMRSSHVSLWHSPQSKEHQ